MIKTYLSVLSLFFIGFTIANAQIKPKTRFQEYTSSSEWKITNQKTSILDYPAGLKMQIHAIRLALSDMIDPVDKKETSNSKPQVAGTKPQVAGTKPYDAPTEACRWDISRPPRILTAPGCTAVGSRLCRGRVICGNQNQVAVCSENFCKENTATECFEQKGYASKLVN